ncbi:MAG: 3-hydroxyacyl-ACP dehydratase FabZ [Pseudomonadota bacterium]
MVEQSPITIEKVDIGLILKTLPHRFPFLLIDRVIDIRADFSGIGIKNVTVNEPQFTGHFPDRPIYPGVLMIEGMAQTAGIIGMLSTETDRPTAVYFLTIDKCKFRKTAGPGDVIHYHMRRITRRKEMWWFHGEAKVDGKIVAEANIGAMLAD